MSPSEAKMHAEVPIVWPDLRADKTGGSDSSTVK
jgi:hypothetical protein